MALNIYQTGLRAAVLFSSGFVLEGREESKGDQPKIDAETAAEENYSGIIK